MPSIARLALYLGATALSAALVAPRLATAAPSPACPPQALPLTAEAVDAGLKKARDHGFLWRLTKDGRSSFLYGTIHVARREWMFPGPTVMEALRASDTLALELDVLDPEIQKRLAASIGAKRDSPPLPAELVRRLDRRKAAECVDAATWARFSPEFQAASLTVLAARRDGLDPAYAIDLVLAGAARDLGKPVASLETPEAQMQALQMASPAETAAFVESSLDDLDRGQARPLMKRIAQVWVDGDYDRLGRYAQWCNCARTPAERALAKRLLDDRNPALAEAIDALHASGKQVFAAVGSLHMVGPGGLPALLQQRGYKVEQGDFRK